MTPAAVWAAVAHVLREHEMSERRACSIVGADRSTIRYRSRRRDDALLRGRLRELATERRRFSYRRLTDEMLAALVAGVAGRGHLVTRRVVRAFP